MKNYFKGLISGLLIAAVFCCIPAVAENIQVMFNQVRINVNGVDKAQWGEDYTLDNGDTAPYSITYKDTTYLPLRKIGELNGKKISYNGDTETVSIAGYHTEDNVIAEKPDKNGNIWKYYTFKTDNGVYLGVKDEQRRYERVYKTMSSDPKTALCIKDDAIYFVRDNGEDGGWPRNKSADLCKIEFLNDESTQDGETIFKFNNIKIVIFDGDYMFYTYESIGTMSRTYIVAKNIFDVSVEEATFDRGAWKSIDRVVLKESGVLEFTVIGSGIENLEITFDKAQNKFSEPIEVEQENNN